MNASPDSSSTSAGVPRWVLASLTGGLAFFGVGALLAAMVIPHPGDPVSSHAGDVASVTSTRDTRDAGPTATPEPSAIATSAQPSVAITSLVDPQWAAAVAKTTTIPPRALLSYAGASLAAAQQFPKCKVGWNMLAAIGFVESAHGTLGGSQVGDDGVAAPSIIGVALNGQGVARIADTDDGRLDGDTTWDRAVGPMQFIPSTWEMVHKDGNGDGRADVHNLDDAVWSAAVHLCDVGGDLSVPANWIAAVHAYNPSIAYNNKVAERATAYAQQVSP